MEKVVAFSSQGQVIFTNLDLPSVGSPRDLFWELQWFLDKEGVKSEKPFEPLKLEPAPIEGHATFRGNVDGHKDILKSTRWRFILGIILCFTIILIY